MTVTAGKTPQGQSIKMLVAGEALNIFLLTGLSNKDIFFINMKNNVLVISNIYDQFASKFLTYIVKNNI